jgi:glycosyltransferase involved in cell wall biosynthesis
MSRRKPKILFVSHDAGRTGAPIGLLAFMRWLREHAHYEMAALLRSPGPLESSFRELGPTVTLGKSLWNRTRLGRRVRRHLPASLRDETATVRRMFADGGYDLIYSNTMTNGTVVRALTPFEKPVVTHAHELEYWISRTGSENLREVIGHTTAYIAASGAVRDNLIRNHGIAGEKITVIHEHIRELPTVPSTADRERAKELLGIPARAFVVGGCGAEHWRKGRDLIPQLLVALRRRHLGTDFHFVWVGRSGTDDEEYALSHDLRMAGVEPLFHSSGEVEDPFPYYAAIDAFALLSRDDPYPLACLEVAALETPVVCFSNAGGIPEFVRDGCGLVAPYLDVDWMAGDLTHLANSPELSRACGLRARAKVARENTVDKTAPLLQSVIEEAWENRRVERLSPQHNVC